MSPTDAALPALQVLDRHGRGLRVTWVQDGDRYAHEIAVVDGSAATVCLWSELGRDRDPWPASPPLQQDSRQVSARGRAKALFLGMAGSSHWSQSIESDDSGLAVLIFDVACRVPVRPPWLGSTYRANAELMALSPSCVRLETAEGCHLTLTALTGQAPAAAFPCSLVVDAGQVAITPDLGQLQLPATVRWRYRIALDAALVAPSNSTF